MSIRCYQCDEVTTWLAPDSRCKNCTRMTPEEIQGCETVEPELEDEQELNFTPDHDWVVHCKVETYDVYIGRPGKWGNPFEIGKHGTRDEVIEKYREYVLATPHLMDSLHELEGMILGCWCAPKACHGDVLVDLAYQRFAKLI